MNGGAGKFLALPFVFFQHFQNLNSTNKYENSVLPLVVVALVGMALATSCEKEKNKEKVESYIYQYDGVNYVNLTIYWHQGKYYTEVTNN